MARQLGAITIGLTGGDGGKLAELVKYALIMPSWHVAHIQEPSLPLAMRFQALMQPAVTTDTTM